MAKPKSAEKKVALEDYHALGDEALNDKIEEESLRLKKMKFAHAVNPIENPMAIRVIRKEIARLKTEQHKRALGASI
jgi:large subunit ribosomal protein L29